MEKRVGGAGAAKKPASTVKVATKPKPFDGFKGASIDTSGTFKYIQIHVGSKKDPSSEKQILIRGFKAFKYHKGIYQNWVQKELEAFHQQDNFEHTCPGGGRIKVTPETKTIFIYGYSKTFGRVSHQVTQDILQAAYPEYNISWSDEGY
ncbi:hypothetical protein FGO68_gene12392 [Halteria grandinella]|uniref:14 kDa phosphohistidine phosphatase n=1 Tax=Halteria grandinella TaxID=5974 RepID=A0A8J8NJ23_HALGN|nr:hypothetical protein FGO68_gene12392 [Halteria grandinella]